MSTENAATARPTGRLVEFPRYTVGQDWTFYEFQIEQYFALEKITEEGDKRALFYTHMSEKLFKLVRSLYTEEERKSKDLKTILTTLGKHLQPKRSVMIHRLTFSQRARKVDESVDDYAVALRELADECKYTD